LQTQRCLLVGRQRHASFPSSFRVDHFLRATVLKKNDHRSDGQWKDYKSAALHKQFDKFDNSVSLDARSFYLFHP
jgi:hypothetical protein